MATIASSGSAAVRMGLASDSGARVVLADAFSTLRRFEPTQAGNGIVEIRGSSFAADRLNSRGGVILLNSEGISLPAMWPNVNGLVLVQQNASASNLTLHSGASNRDGRFRIFDSDEDRVIHFSGDLRDVDGDLFNNQTLTLEAATDGSLGRLILSFDNIVEQPYVVLESAQNFIQLRGNQDAPAALVVADTGISGIGGLIKNDSSVTELGNSNSYTGGTWIHDGTVRLVRTEIPESADPGAALVDFDGTIGSGRLYIGGNGQFDLNGLSQTVSGIGDLDGDGGTVALGNGGTLTVDTEGNTSFSGSITGTGSLIITGDGRLTLTEDYVNAAGRTLRVEGGVFEVDANLTIEDGSFQLAGGQIVAEYILTQGMLWDVMLTENLESLNLVEVFGADISLATLNLQLMEAYTPALGTDFTLLYAGDAIIGASESNLFGYGSGDIIDVGGVQFSINWVEGSESIVLTVVPEPATYALLFASLVSVAVLIRRRGQS